MMIASILSFSHYDFKWLFLEGHQNSWLRANEKFYYKKRYIHSLSPFYFSSFQELAMRWWQVTWLTQDTCPSPWNTSCPSSNNIGRRQRIQRVSFYSFERWSSYIQSFWERTTPVSLISWWSNKYTIVEFLQIEDAPPSWLSGERVGLMVWWLGVRSLVEANFVSGIFSALTFAEPCEKSGRWIWKVKLCYYWCEKARKHICVTDRHDMTLAVEVALKPNTTNQIECLCRRQI